MRYLIGLAIFLFMIGSVRANDFTLLDATNTVQDSMVAAPAITLIISPNALDMWKDAISGPIKGGRGYKWLPASAQFQFPAPFPSWIWSATAQNWFSPIPVPFLTPNSGWWEWSEASQNWNFVANSGTPNGSMLH